MKPSIGRIVHFFVHEYQISGQGTHEVELVPYPAIITKVHNDRLVNLVVFGGEFHNVQVTSVPHVDDSEGAALGARTWTWPPRV